MRLTGHLGAVVDVDPSHEGDVVVKSGHTVILGALRHEPPRVILGRRPGVAVHPVLEQNMNNYHVYSNKTWTTIPPTVTKHEQLSPRTGTKHEMK